MSVVMAHFTGEALLVFCHWLSQTVHQSVLCLFTLALVLVFGPWSRSLPATTRSNLCVAVELLQYGITRLERLAFPCRKMMILFPHQAECKRFTSDTLLPNPLHLFLTT